VAEKPNADALPPPGQALAERYADFAASLDASRIPEAVRAVARRQVIDVAGLCLAARRTDYVESVRSACEPPGPCTVIGHAHRLIPADAAMVNGTAAHGEDYDDTFEGTPVHPGAVVVPAALACAQRWRRSGSDLLAGIAAGDELMCRLALVSPGEIHRAGFHPTAVIGALGAAAAAGVTLGLDATKLASALGIAGSLASGIIEYLAEGTWTKRLHAGWAARAGIHAARLAACGFLGPRTVLDGRHGFFHAFTNAGAGADLDMVGRELGARWHAAHVAFKPYPCGTMAQPFIDCALSLRRDGLNAEEIASITCRVGEGTVHRLWEPLGEKRRPSSAYSAKFSVPFCIAAALTDGAVGLGQFSEPKVRDPKVLSLAGRIGYEVDPADEYPANYSGHLRVVTVGGEVREVVQPHLRGGRREPLDDGELTAKFLANAAHGGVAPGPAARALECAGGLLDCPELGELSDLASQ
jgi:2-methylcitrate dehydratase PrpD